MLRTHTCGQLRGTDTGQQVTLCGWVDSYRDHGRGLFVDLRDRYGITQVVFNHPQTPEDVIEASKSLRSEYVIQIDGEVAARPQGQENPKLRTGQIEVRAARLVVLNRSNTPPFEISARRPEGLASYKEWETAAAAGSVAEPTFRQWLAAQEEGLPVGEEKRLEYRYLDLRRERMQNILLLRHRIVKLMRDYFDEHGFIDVETPVLGRSTPEGARDYLVPSRIQSGHFFALPQSPQLYKQILMIAGYDRYVQVARCFRDEDLRADRQPEFTQLDMEMAFVDSDDVIGMIDGLVARLASQLLGHQISQPLPRMTYDEAMRRFGHDAPDLRFGMELIDATDLAADADFRVFRSVAESGGSVRGINVQGARDRYSRKGIDELTAYVQQDFGTKGLAWFKVEPDGSLASPIAKNFAASLLENFCQRFAAKPGDLLLIVADSFEVTSRALNGLRNRLARELELYQPGDMHFSWVVEFPMFAYDDDAQCWAAMHHPFTAPRPQDLPLLETDPGKCRAQAYDLVINGSEAGGGTIRIHDQSLQRKVFQLLGIDRQSAQQRFGFLLDALEFGAPPHGGIALGIDRWVMLFAGLENIRDCIAFPKTQRAADLMTGAPGSVGDRQWKELGIKISR